MEENRELYRPNLELYEERHDSKGRPFLIALPDAEGVRHCFNCGDPLTARKKCYCLKSVELECHECGKAFFARCDRHIKGREFCSARCANSSPIRVVRTQETVKERYGVSTVLKLPENQAKAVKASQTDEAWGKRKATNRDRYGADFPAQNPELKEEYLRRQREKNGGKLAFNTEKQKITNRKRYGGDSPFSDPAVRSKAQETQRSNNDGKLGFNNDKQRATMMAKYGSPGRLGNPDELERQREKMLELYGVQTPCEYPQFLAKAMATIIERHGMLFGSGSVTSKTNSRFAKDIESRLGVKLSLEKQLDGVFFDLYSEEHKVLIELNPTVTHNSTKSFTCLRMGCPSDCRRHPPLRKSYHYDKSKIALKHGYNLIHVYDWDDSNAIEAILEAKLGVEQKKISARKMEMRRISQKEANSFLAKNHIQGASKGQAYCYGLYLENKLLAVATFSKARFGNKLQFEFNRYAVARGYRIFGGAEKMFKQFCAEASPDSIVSYVDFNHSTRASFLESLGFTLSHFTGPELSWTKKGSTKRIPATSLLKIGADRLLGTSYGPKAECGMNNEQIMLAEGWVKVYTAGNKVYTWHKSDKMELLNKQEVSKK